MNEEKSRLDHWKEPKNLGFGMTHDDESNAKEISALYEKLNNNRKNGEEVKFTTSTLIAQCKELIFDIIEGKIIFHGVAYYLSSKFMEIQVGLLFEISSNDDERTDEEEAIDLLAIAAIEEVPVYPNKREHVQALAELHRRLLVEGFTAPSGDGKRVRLKFAKRPTTEFLDTKYFQDLDGTIPIFPAEVALIRETALREIAKLSRAESVLAALEKASYELSEQISVGYRNENNIQRCITSNPILFGVEYVSILPKHRLGSEYEMDYAAERFGGIYDLIELESSNLKLYNRNGDPSKNLIHAEQQVLDWLGWIEENNSYANKSLPAIASPVGYVVMGRRSDLSMRAQERLRRRNLYWNGRIVIMTYDDLLDRSRNIMVRLLSGSTRA